MDAIVNKIRQAVGGKTDEVRSFFMRNDPDGQGIIQYEQLSTLLRQVDPSMTDHEIMSLARMYAERCVCYFCFYYKHTPHPHECFGVNWNLSSQAKDTDFTLFVMYPWPLASLKIETPAATPIEYHESRNLC